MVVFPIDKEPLVCGIWLNYAVLHPLGAYGVRKGAGCPIRPPGFCAHQVSSDRTGQL